MTEPYTVELDQAEGGDAAVYPDLVEIVRTLEANPGDCFLYERLFGSAAVYREGQDEARFEAILKTQDRLSAIHQPVCTDADHQKTFYPR